MPIFYEGFPKSHVKESGYSIYFGFEALITMITKNTILWDVTPCSPVEFHGRFEGAYSPIFRVRLRSACRVILAGYLLELLSSPKDGGRMFLRNVSSILPYYTPLHPRRQYNFYLFIYLRFIYRCLL
jgi:hypothetical protein